MHRDNDTAMGSSSVLLCFSRLIRGSLKDRIGEHLGYIRNKDLKQATGYHFNLKGHSQDNLRVIALEKVKKYDVLYRKERESHLIRKFNTFYQGLNRMP